MTNRRMPKEKYEAMKRFKRQIREERAGKFVRDHSGRVYRINEDGSLVRMEDNIASSITDRTKL